MKRTIPPVCLACLIAAALWTQTHATQDVVGTLELTVRAEATGHYAEDSQQRGAGSKATVIDKHVDDKISLMMAGRSSWPIKSRDGFDDELFEIQPDAFTSSITGHGSFSEAQTHLDLCDVGLNSPRQERSFTNNQDMNWTSKTPLPGRVGTETAAILGLGHVVVTRDTADPDRGMYTFAASIPTPAPAVTGQETVAQRGCDGTDTKGGTLSSTPIGDGGAFTIVTDTVKEAMEDAAFSAELKGTFDRHSKGFSVTRHALFRYAPKDDVLDEPPDAAGDGGVHSREHHDGFLHLTYTLTYHVETDVDAVIEPEAGYDDWMPEAPSGTYEPRPLEIHVRIHRKGAPDARASQTARFRFELVDTSQEFGYCLNAPKRPDADFEPPPPDEPFDLEIGAKDNPDLRISDKGQRAETKDGLSDARVLINPADWGAYSRLKVTAILKDGTEIVAHLAKDAAKRELRVPIDDNDNHIADGWEKSLGIFSRNLPADWNQANDPSKQLKDGDGISLYEKYRGFEFDGRHESLQPMKKYLFLFDQDGLYKAVFARPETAGLDFASLSGLEVRLIADTEWTGIGAASEGHRTVNFNHRTGHADDQHALHLAVSNPWAGARSSTPTGFFGITWPDGPDVFGPPRVALRSVVDSAKCFDSIIAQAVAVACALPRPGGPLPYPACERDAIAKAYADEHMKEFFEGVFKFLALVITHELAHAVGVQHHDAKEDGNRQCVMRYFRKIECGVDPQDPVNLKCRSPWPAKLVGPDKQSYAGMGCYQQITVNDAR